MGHVRHFLLADIWPHSVNKKAMVFAGGRIKKRMSFTSEGNYFSDRFSLGHPASGLRLEIFCNCFFFLSTGLLTSLAIKHAGFSVEGWLVKIAKPLCVLLKSKYRTPASFDCYFKK